MPSVHISLMKDKPEGFGKRVGGVVYRTMIDTINVTANDNFQIIRDVAL
jgi:hypothetical protein